MKLNKTRKNLIMLITYVLLVFSIGLETTAQKNGNPNDNSVQQIPVHRIDILMRINDDATCGIIFRYVISSDTMQTMGEKIDEYMYDRFENGGISTTKESDPGEEFCVYSFEIQNIKFSELNRMLAAHFGQDGVSLAVEEMEDPYSPFLYGKKITLDFDLPDQLAAEDGKEIPLALYIKHTDEYKYVITEGLEEARQWNSHYEQRDSTLSYDEILKARYGGKTIHLPLWIINNYQVKRLDVKLRHENREWTKTSTFIFIGKISAEKSKKILEGFEKLIQQLEVERRETKVSVTDVWEDDGYKLILTQKGDDDTIKAEDAVLFGYQGGMEYSRDSRFWTVKKKELIKGGMDYSRILPTVPYSFELSCSVPVGTAAVCEYCNFENAVTENGMLCFSTGERSVNLDYEGTAIDKRACALWICVAVILLLLASAAGIMIRRVIRLRAGHGQKKAYFCPGCGRLLVSDDVICPACGYGDTGKNEDVTKEM